MWHLSAFEIKYRKIALKFSGQSNICAQQNEMENNVRRLAFTSRIKHLPSSSKRIEVRRRTRLHFHLQCALTLCLRVDVCAVADAVDAGQVQMVE